MKLNRSQIKEALEQTPIDKLLLGANAKDITLTHKQKAFAEEIAKGATKAEAYRKAYNSKGTSQTQSKEGTKLLANPSISHHVESIKLAIEAQKYLFPTHLRALVIQQLTEKALDPSVNHAQQIKALELIGKFSDVALFQERKETKSNDNSQDAKDRLMHTLSNAIRASRNISDEKKREAQDLLDEIANDLKDKPNPITIDQSPSDDDQLTQDDEPTIVEPPPSETDEIITPPGAAPQKNFEPTEAHMHTIPHEPTPTFDVSRGTLEMPPLSFTKSEWGGGDNFWDQFEELPTENTPLDKSGSHDA